MPKPWKVAEPGVCSSAVAGNQGAAEIEPTGSLKTVVF